NRRGSCRTERAIAGGEVHADRAAGPGAKQEPTGPTAHAAVQPSPPPRDLRHAVAHGAVDRRLAAPAGARAGSLDRAGVSGAGEPGRIRRPPLPHAPAARAPGALPRPHARAPPGVSPRLDGHRLLPRARAHALVHGRLLFRLYRAGGGAGRAGVRARRGRPVSADRRVVVRALRGDARPLSPAAGRARAARPRSEPAVRFSLWPSPPPPPAGAHALGELQHLLSARRSPAGDAGGRARLVAGARATRRRGDRRVAAGTAAPIVRARLTSVQRCARRPARSANRPAPPNSSTMFQNSRSPGWCR